MRVSSGFSLLALAVALPVLADSPGVASAGASQELVQLLSDMQARLARLEARNAELEQRLQASPSPLPPLSASLPAGVAPLQGGHAEQPPSAAVSAAREETPPEVGVSTSAALTLVAQRAVSGRANGDAENALNYRADIEVTLPAGQIGQAQGKLFGHFRLGQGNGLLSLNPTFTGSVNSTAFQLAGAADDATALLAQAWYQLDIPLGMGNALDRLEITVGKIDPFVFFDGNAIADDESEAFLNNVFVHNPLLDSGGDAGVDAYGFTPGLRLGYFRNLGEASAWGMSLGVFGAGAGARFNGSLSRPFLVAQAEYGGKAFHGLQGNYRLYAWSNERALALDGVTEQRHQGWGISFDQQVAENLTLFTRLGLSAQGEVSFDRALTLGGQIAGAAWGREHDRLGLAVGWLDASHAYQLANPGATGAERQFEVFYAWQPNEHFQLSPSIQWVSRPAADGSAENITVLGVRAKASY